MTRVLATAADVGRSCPYCRFPLKQGVAVERCDACNSLHHEDCWNEGGGCAVLGCAGAAPTVAHERPSAAPIGGARPGALRNGVSPLLLAGLIALAGVAVGAVLASGVLGHGPNSRAAAAPKAPSAIAPQSASVAELAQGRRAIVAILDAYQRDYSNHDIGGLAQIFSTTIRRHGLSSGGCSAVQGRGAVLHDYESQFEAGTGTYRLVGLHAGQIGFEGPERAHLDGNYEISTGGSGFVNFWFAKVEGAWKITEVYATCA